MRVVQMKRVFTFTLLLSFAANSALPEWAINSDNVEYPLTGSSCVRITNSNQKSAEIISKSIAKADLIEKQGVMVSSMKRLTIANSEKQAVESFNQTITTQSQGFVSSVTVIDSGFYKDKFDDQYHCTWIGIK
jgi:hypothetical protein